MSNYYVRKTGDNGNDGLTPATAKLTLNGAEDIPVAAGDTIYIGAGTYRETLTCDVSGSAGSPITYIGDYRGQYTGDAGVVRITGSDNDITQTRNQVILGIDKHFRSFKYFNIDLSIWGNISFSSGSSNIIIDSCSIGPTTSDQIIFSNPGLNNIVRNCYLAPSASGIKWSHSSALDDRNGLVENCIILSRTGFVATRCGGVLIRNCHLINNGAYAVFISAALSAGQFITVNNCIINGCNYRALAATALGEIVENYNSFSNNAVDRFNVAVGANSNTYPPLFDARWFFESIDYG